MKALILAAGLGTRLRPLTEKLPKALVEVAGKPLLLRAIEHLSAAGVRDILINVHYLADQVETFVRGIELPGVRFFIQDERALLLDTGGSIRQAKDFFADAGTALILNADVISDLDLQAMLRQHVREKALVTLDVRSRPSGRYLLFGPDQCLVGWEHVSKATFKWVRGPQEHFQRLAFSGIQMLDARAFDLLPEQTAFSSIDWYLELAAGHRVMAYQDPDSLWLDVGDAEKLAEAEKQLKAP